MCEHSGYVYILRNNNGSTKGFILGGFLDEDDAESTKAKLKRPKEWEIVSVPLDDTLEDPAGPPELDLFGHRIKDYEY